MELVWRDVLHWLADGLLAWRPWQIVAYAALTYF
jgi:hypothetical protein